ncbi:hypothetical protein K445DRAFT_283712 [Daldinia sp. EC12]|nr:hypothetical protein K445DRAFT_283712 [Daldinia sp. EC12]
MRLFSSFSDPVTKTIENRNLAQRARPPHSFGVATVASLSSVDQRSHSTRLGRSKFRKSSHPWTAGTRSEELCRGRLLTRLIIYLPMVVVAVAVAACARPSMMCIHTNIHTYLTYVLVTTTTLLLHYYMYMGWWKIKPRVPKVTYRAARNKARKRSNLLVKLREILANEAIKKKKGRTRSFPGSVGMRKDKMKGK